jgi:hypothetical protein
MAQGEQFFTARVRQNKRVRFLSYWGEGHVPETQANTRDTWERIFAWLDQFIGPKGTARPRRGEDWRARELRASVRGKGAAKQVAASLERAALAAAATSALYGIDQFAVRARQPLMGQEGLPLPPRSFTVGLSWDARSATTPIHHH